MGGASPSGSTDPLKKPADTKDGTTPLAPGHSQEVTGASAGAAAPNAGAAAAAGKGAGIRIDPGANTPKATDGGPLFSITTVGPNGKPWLHEFRTKRDPKTTALVVEGDPKSGTVNAVWERVPSGYRPSSGDPGYVDDVKRYDPNTGVRIKKQVTNYRED